MVYHLTWVTADLAVGHAPMSYEDLNSIRARGIDAIVNLCAEFCDLHEIEEKSGFEVYYLPIPDENAPDMQEMEAALAWLDEAIYLGKKVLVHCRHGIGRTGTFVTSYLLRRGLGLKLASKKLKSTRAKPTNYCQWRLLKKYGKRSGRLKIREPSLESRNVVDLSRFFAEYEALTAQIDRTLAKASDSDGPPACGSTDDTCCRQYFELELFEAIFLLNRLNRAMPTAVRRAAIERAVAVCRQIRELQRKLSVQGINSDQDPAALARAYDQQKVCCPLSVEGKCLLYPLRPIRCRLYGHENALDTAAIRVRVSELSHSVFLAFSGCFMADGGLSFPLAEVVSGRFVQRYFYYLAAMP